MLFDGFNLKNVTSQQVRDHGGCCTLPYSRTGGHSSLADRGKSDGGKFLVIRGYPESHMPRWVVNY